MRQNVSLVSYGGNVHSVEKNVKNPSGDFELILCVTSVLGKKQENLIKNIWK